MKITTNDGVTTTTHEFRDIDEYRAYLRIQAELRGQMVVATAPVIEPEIVGDEDEDEDDEFEDLKVFTKRRHRNVTPNPPAPAGRWPDLIYLTEAWNEVFELLRAYPEGLTSEELGYGMGIPLDIASGRAMRLREATPLIRMEGNRHLLTEIGADLPLRVMLTQNPGRRNKQLGWERFMALPLRDGSRRKRRR